MSLVQAIFSGIRKELSNFTIGNAAKPWSYLLSQVLGHAATQTKPVLNVAQMPGPFEPAPDWERRSILVALIIKGVI